MNYLLDKAALENGVISVFVNVHMDRGHSTATIDGFLLAFL